MRSGSDDTRPDCQASKPGYIGNTQLALDVGHLLSHGFRTEAERPGNIVNRFAVRQQA